MGLCFEDHSKGKSAFNIGLLVDSGVVEEM